MTISPVIARLLHIRELQEEQCRLELESALRAVQTLQAARGDAADRARRGRELIRASGWSNEPVERLSGIVEEGIAVRLQGLLEADIAQAEQRAGMRRETYVAARIGRSQIGTLVKRVADGEARRQAAMHQFDLDEWFRSRR